MNNDSKPQLSKKRITIIATGTSLALLAALAVGIPLMQSDGTEAFGGAEKQVATSALAEFGSPYNGIDRVNHLDDLRSRVERVVSVTASEVGCSPDKHGYLVIISHRTFFGIQTGLTAVSPCEVKSGQSLQVLYPDLDLQ
jgi:hypothetical protein